MSAPQGPGWWQASDGRWYPPQPQPQYPPPGQFTQPYYPQAQLPKKSNRGCLISILVFVVVLIVAVVGITWWIGRTVGDAVSGVTGATDIKCPDASEISELLGANVTGPTAPKFFVAAACYYEPASPDDIYEVIIVSGAKLVADDQIASMKSEGQAAGATPFSIDVGDRGVAWASSTKSSAIAVGDKALVSVEVQGKNFTEIPDQSDAAIAILEKVLY